MTSIPLPRTAALFALVLLLTFGARPILAQHGSVETAAVRPDLLTEAWAAKWIAHPDHPRDEFGVYHFRKAFQLSAVPERVVVHVTGDNRYRLFVNGAPVVNGPARGDVLNWRFESIDIAPFLRAGDNVLAAVVWNYAGQRPVAQISDGTGFLLQADDPQHAEVNTGNTWKVTRSEGYGMIPLGTMDLRTYIVVGPGERLDASKYPWGWSGLDFDDDGWSAAAEIKPGEPKGVHDYGVQYGWMLVPREIPLMEETPQRIPEIERAEGIRPSDAFLNGTGDLTVLARTKATLLLDQTHLTTAYPVMTTSGGRGATVKFTYAEALVDGDRQKGHRDVTEGKHILGYYDVFELDGGAKREYRTLWWRTWRYLQLDIETGEEPLILHDLHGLFTAYPFEQNAAFAASDTSLARIWDVGWRTARLCAGETYFDAPYYEQLQYVADTRIQALISLYNAGDDRLMRQAIANLHLSRIPDGLTASRYPSRDPQYIPPFSLFWIDMVHDYWMHRDDSAFVAQQLTGVRGVIDWYEPYIDDAGMLGPMPWWNFGDWSYEDRGVPPGAEDGNSALLSLQLVYALDRAAELADAFGRAGDAQHYAALAGRVRDGVRGRVWHPGRRLFAETPEQATFTQQTNIFAVLTGLVPEADQAAFMRRVLADASLLPASYYFRFYLNRALQEAGVGDLYVGALTPWREMLAKGLSTFAEQADPTRSDCHAWSASPNYDFLALVAGIRPAEPGFKSVIIEPALGSLSSISAAMPHPLGEIRVDLKRSGSDGVEGTVTLPPGLSGTFRWGTSEIPLSGASEIRL